MGSLVAAKDPAKALALMDRSAEVVRQTSFGNQNGKEMRMVYLTESVTPLVALGRLDQAKRHTDEARKMVELGEVDKESETRVFRKEAEWMYKAGRQREALQAALRVKDWVSRNVRMETLSSGYQLILALEAIQTYARTIEPSVCKQATEQAADFWDKAQSSYQTSEIVKSKARVAKARAEDPAHCVN